VWDSTTDEEYGETLLKAQLICSPAPRFHLLETLLWEPVTGFFLLDKHLARLQDSAHYFDFTCDRASIRQQLQTYCRPFGSSPMRVRLTLDQSGLCSLEATELPPQSPAPLTLGLCSQRVDANVRFLYHKTTHRTLYEEARAHTPAGCDDSILINSDNQLTETTIGNLLYRLDGALYTPPVHCGLLAGCYRAQLLEQGTIRERVLALEEIDKVEEWLRTNSVRGMQRAVLVRGD
jgi:para-aminobenzoate synthetase/4-amino-4-deoxychorismate lyase